VPLLVLLAASCASDARKGHDAAVAQAPPTPSPAVVQPAHTDSLIAQDFTLLGIPLEADSAWVLRVFGRPDSITVEENPFDTGGKLPSWHYRDIDVQYTYSDTVFGMAVRSPAYKTRRGVGVGSSAAEIQAAYGEPTSGGQPNGLWEYLDPLQDLHTLTFTLRAGLVVQVYFGYILD
jgi:hypothetical protein